jgi:hypothetical protein
MVIFAGVRVRATVCTLLKVRKVPSKAYATRLWVPGSPFENKETVQAVVCAPPAGRGF